MSTQPNTNPDLQSLLPGARTAVRTCMNVQADERVVIITDDATLAIGQALAAETEAAGAVALVCRLEEYTTRPVFETPAALVEAINAFNPTVSFYAASSLKGEIQFRMSLGRALRLEHKVRHGHMPSITPQLMREGMTTDYDRIYKITHRVNDIARAAERMHITNPKGTDLHAEFSPDLKWVPCHGRYHQPGDWGNLPEGETFTCPAKLDGVIVADILGDYFSDKYGLLDTPVIFVIVDSLVTEVRSENAAVADEVRAYLDSKENGRRAGEFAIGTNIGLTHLVGNLLQDEKYPGIHVAFGNPYPHATGADWASEIHVDVIPVQCTIDVDGRRIMTDGVFAPDILESR